MDRTLYSPAQFRAGDRRHHELCERHNIKVSCVTPHTKEGYLPVGKSKDINPFGHLYSHNDPENVDTVSWTYVRVHATRMACVRTSPQARPGEADRASPSAPSDEAAEVYMILWQYPLAFAEDAPDASDARACMAVRAVGTGPVFGSEVLIDVSGNEHDDFTKAEARSQCQRFRLTTTLVPVYPKPEEA